ncbi:hypothetical protein DASC09_002940 [Saccharomycopsis crataegensis]|uniref:Rab-GAP TBC domain-containing protein n=1 Tax=Saccharomycopsis crataegensis TaxID=43959 RepID=A0AAV5QF45_9ASCO|nr:hypothetical protein DASC09_002940 [Saccharomycopsis crataegensis]
MSDILLEIESSLADQENSSNSIRLMLSNLKDDISDNEAFEQEPKITKKQINELCQKADDVDVVLVCPKCNNFLFTDDLDAKSAKLTESSGDCCQQYYEKCHKISRTNLEYWYYFLNNPFKTINTLPNYTRFLFYSIEGIPTQLRSRIWGMLLGSCTNFGEINNNWCESLFANLNGENSPYLRVIVNDLNRIFPNLDYFQNKELGQANLKKILNAYSLYDAEIGYCQGLSFLIGLILFHFKSNPMTFLATINIFEQKKNLNFKKIFDEKMSGLKLWFYQFEEIFKKHNVTLYNHFKELNIDLRIFTSKWFLSFFAVGCPMQILIKLFDIMFIEGFQSSIFKISLIILSKNSNILMELSEAEEVHQLLLSTNIWDCYESNLNLIIDDLLSLNPDLVSQEFLQELEDKFKKDQSKLSHSTSSSLLAPKNSSGHRHTKSANNLIVNVSKANCHEKTSSISIGATSSDISGDTEAPIDRAQQVSKSVSNTPMEAESSFFRFFKYGFSNPATAIPTPTDDHYPIEESANKSITLDALIAAESTKNDVSVEKSGDNTHEELDSSTRSSTCSNLFDDDSFSQNETESSNSSTNSPILSNEETEKNKKKLVNEIIINSPDIDLENQANSNNNGGSLIPKPQDSQKQQQQQSQSKLSNSFSCSTQLNDQINYFSNIPPPHAKSNSGHAHVGHSRTVSEMSDYHSLSKNTVTGLSIENSKKYHHSKNYSVSNVSLYSTSTDGSTFSAQPPTMLSPSSQLGEPTFSSFNHIMNTSAPIGGSALSPSLKGMSNHHRGHSYTPSISSISSINKRNMAEMREIEMASEMESLKFKLESYERVIEDDKQLIKSLFKLYLMKDDLAGDELDEAGKAKLENKLKRREYKVLKEVEERLKL